MKKTVCKTYFSILGEFNIDDISEIMGIKNTEGHSIGYKKQYDKGIYDWSSWSYGTEYEETFFGEEQANSVILVLKNKIEQLIEIKKIYNCRFILMQVPKIKDGKTPSLGFNKEIIDFCSKTGSEIEIDLYSN